MSSAFQNKQNAQLFMDDQSRVNNGYKQRVHQALQDDELRQNFRGAMDFLTQKRAAVFPDSEEFNQLSEQGSRIRRRALRQLPELLERLENRCNQNGTRVHWAENAQDARAIILEILQAKNAKRLVKGKSMASEEIGLNHFLEEQGIECLESDMGEYIVQLDKSTPSHIIMPAIHKNTRQIAELFENKIPGCEYTEEVDQLIGTGRKVLRQKFYEADAGLSGVNFAIAETGTLCLVENEGNGRMCTTIPKIHIALCGIEKVVEKLSDIPPLLSLLTRSATGQSITTYFNMINGPRKADELDGPEEVHLVLLDNGRSRMYSDEELRQTLECIRCGACMNHCPVYTRIGGHAYGATYPGPIGQVVSPQIWGLDQAGKLDQACSLNGACRDACPVNIPLPDLIRRLRHDGNHAAEKSSPSGLHPSTEAVPGRGHLRKPMEAALWKLWASVNRHNLIYKLSLFLATRMRHFLPTGLGAWSRYRRPPVPAKRSLHEMVNSLEPKNSPELRNSLEPINSPEPVNSPERKNRSSTQKDGNHHES